MTFGNWDGGTHGLGRDFLAGEVRGMLWENKRERGREGKQDLGSLEDSSILEAASLAFRVLGPVWFPFLKTVFYVKKHNDIVLFFWF